MTSEGIFHDAHEVYYNPIGTPETRMWIATFASKNLADSYVAMRQEPPMYFEVIPV